MRLASISLIFMIVFAGCIANDAPKPDNQPTSEPTDPKSNLSGFTTQEPPTFAEQDVIITPHEGWIEVNSPFLKLNGAPPENRGGTLGWYFLEYRKGYKIEKLGDATWVTTLPLVEPKRYSYNAGTELQSDQECQWGYVLRNAQSTKIFGLTGSACTSMGALVGPASNINLTTQKIGQTVYENENSGWALFELTNWKETSFWRFMESPPAAVQVNFGDEIICARSPGQALGYGYVGPICGQVEGTSAKANLLHTSIHGRVLPGSPVQLQETGEFVGLYAWPRTLGGSTVVGLCVILEELKQEFEELQRLLGTTKAALIGTVGVTPSGYNPTGVYGGKLDCAPREEPPRSEIDLGNTPF